MRRMWLALAGETTRVGIAAAIIGIGLMAVGCEETKEVVAPPPPEVFVADVIQRDVPVYLELVGQTQGFQDVEIRARVEGYLTNMSFQEGSLVRKGDPAVRDRPPAPRSDPGRGQSPTGHGGGAAGQGQQRRRALHAARGQAGGEPARAG